MYIAMQNSDKVEQRNDNKIVNENIKNSIEYKTFRDLVKVSRIVDRSINDNNVTDIINLYEQCPGTPKFEKFILKIEFDVSMLEYSQITLFDIYDKIVTNKKIKQKFKYLQTNHVEYCQNN